MITLHPGLCYGAKSGARAVFSAETPRGRLQICHLTAQGSGSCTEWSGIPCGALPHPGAAVGKNHGLLELLSRNVENKWGEVGANCSDGGAIFFNSADFHLGRCTWRTPTSEKITAGSERFTPRSELFSATASKRAPPPPIRTRSFGEKSSGVGAIYSSVAAKSFNFAAFRYEQNTC